MSRSYRMALLKFTTFALRGGGGLLSFDIPHHTAVIDKCDTDNKGIVHLGDLNGVHFVSVRHNN